MKLRKGFTLIELLVVISIIALLLSILMPSLQKVKKQAQTVIGRANLKQLNLGMVMYVDDFNSRFWQGWNGVGLGSQWWMSAVKQYAGDIGKIRFCPAATKLRYREDGSQGIGYGKEPYTAWGHSPTFLAPFSPLPDSDYGSYISNGWVEDKPDNLIPNPSDIPKYWRRYNKIAQANTVPFLTDGQWIDGWPEANSAPPAGENDFWGDGGSHMVRFVQNRHNKHQNVMFMDGSASLTGLKQLWTLKWHRLYNTKGMYTLAGGATRSRWESVAPWMAGMKAY